MKSQCQVDTEGDLFLSARRQLVLILGYDKLVLILALSTVLSTAS